jgi:hypothetical protein
MAEKKENSRVSGEAGRDGKEPVAEAPAKEAEAEGNGPETAEAEGKEEAAEEKPATAAPAKEEAAAEGNGPETGGAFVPIPYWDVNDLPADLHQKVDKLLIEGARFEDVLEVVERSRQATIPLAAIEFYFRSNLSLQQQRVLYLRGFVRELKNSFQDPDSAQAELAEALILQGMMGTRRVEPGSDLPDAFRAKDQIENYRLKAQAADTKAKLSLLEVQMLRTRIRSEHSKFKILGYKIAELKRLAERQAGSNQLTPEMIRRIDEVYGLTSTES